MSNETQRFAPPGPLGFGGAPMGNMFDALHDAQAAATLAAWDSGVRYFDTGPLWRWAVGAPIRCDITFDQSRPGTHARSKRHRRPATTRLGHKQESSSFRRNRVTGLCPATLPCVRAADPGLQPCTNDAANSFYYAGALADRLLGPDLPACPEVLHRSFHPRWKSQRPTCYQGRRPGLDPRS